MEVKELEAALEGILFAAGEPVGVERLCLSLETDRPTLDAVARQLMDRYRYERRGIRIVRMDASYQMCSAPEYAPYIRKTLEGRKPPRLSQPALEVLAIIAYYQPVTRAYVDQIRGVDSAYTVGLLLERELIEESGRLAVPGRPILYRTTKNFLRSFGMASLEELPDGALVGVPNDVTNEARALQLLESAGLITLKEGVGLEATTNDIVDNPKNLEFLELEAAMLPNVTTEVDIAAINGNYALQAGFSSAADAIYTEDPNSEAAQTFANIIVVKEGNENNPAVQALVEALQSDAVRDYINETYDGNVLPIF